MWTRAELKSRGKESIKRNYWLVVLAALIAGILNGEFTGNVSYNSIKDEMRDAAYSGGTFDFLRSPEFLVILTALIGIAIAFLWRTVTEKQDLACWEQRFREETIRI